VIDFSQVKPADPRAAIAGYLLDTIGDQGGLEGRVFRPELPQAEDDLMPRACIVVSADGGYSMFGDDYLPVGDPRLAIRCYGSTRQESDEIGDLAMLALKHMHNGTWEGVRVQWVRITSGIIPMVDADTLWAFSLIGIQVMCDEFIAR
jgi:hypothetical protein